MSKILLTAHPESMAVAQAWQDEAIVTGERYVERPHWYENVETGQTYYEVFGCLGWPSEVSDKDEGLPGYAGVVGIVRPKSGVRAAKDAVFQLLAEIEDRDVPTLLDGVLQLRSDYGFGIYPGLMQTFWGDPDRFITILALLNERLTVGGMKNAILVSPPGDFYEPKAFDHYVRSMRSVLMPDKVRFYFGKNDILKTRLKEFRQNDPAVFAMGGLVHSLLLQSMWMDFTRENSFNVEGEEDLPYE